MVENRGFAWTKGELLTPMLQVRLFGPVTTLVNGEPLPPLRSRRGLYLLALLALRANREVPRLWLAGMLWPESDDTRGLENLRRSLTDLRDALGPAAELLQSPTKHTLLLKITAEQADVLAFDEGIQQDTIASLEKAIALYNAPLLEGCYEEWIHPEREARLEAYLAAVERLAVRKQAQGELASLIPALRKAIGIAPLRESLCRLLMEVLAATGNPSAAGEVYRELRTQLLREHNAAPSASLTALYDRIRTEASASVSAPPPPPAPKKVTPRYQLPRPLTELIGRERELEAIQACLKNSCLVTLTGTGGIGKTRLALQTAWEQQRVSAEGACFVDLAPLRDPALLPRATAASLGLHETEDQPLLESLIDYLRSSSVLIVLDNCEHLIDACAVFVGRLLRDCPSLQILTTSRQPLGITGEVVWRVPVLEVPSLESLSEELVNRFASLRLFFERARAVQPALTLNPNTIQAAIEICRHLDGIALAIELAAARAKSLTVEQIAVRLDDRFRFLTGGSRNALPRQQTLRALIDWSYDLLPDPERLLLGRLAIFSDSFTLDAAEAICAEGEDLLDKLEQLVDKSLVLAEETSEGQLRYRMLETIRQYSREKLDSDEETELIGRFCDWYLRLAIDTEPKILGQEQAHWLKVLDLEHNNLRQALSFSEGVVLLELCAYLGRYWYLHNHWSEGRELLEHALASLELQEGTAVRARALNAAGNLASRQGDYAAAIVFYDECLTIRRALGDRMGMASLLNNFATVLREQGDYERSPRIYQESLDLCRELGDETGMIRALNNLGMVANEQGDNERALVLYAEARALNQSVGNVFLEANTLNNLGNVELDRGDTNQARLLTEQAMVIYQKLGASTGVAFCLDNLGRIALSVGDYTNARAFLEESLKLNRELGDQRGIAVSLNNLGLVLLALGELEDASSLLLQSLEKRNWPSIAGTLVALGHLALRHGQLARAASLYGAAEQLSLSMRRVLALLEKRLRDDDIEHLSERLGADAFARAYERGRAFSQEDLLSFVTTSNDSALS